MVDSTAEQRRELQDARKEAMAQLYEDEPSFRQATLRGTKFWMHEYLN